ncbi:MAG: transcriptional repressor [Alphaproteobacteria bacterium]|jgi:Fur family ferric uptake transcriptional regulator|nr:transcriptional repressor [Alphaproteobacteria bacterium]MCB1551258.1 transcriptional repressor [Alphaproteobacteria bacterium]MCB9984525.1 transcriptional repressor [Micavibrio sp.]HRK97710.1 Fur family transcriptional regulator [Alphaproteobacteria bacterium]
MKTLETRCAEAGLKMTGQRKTILKILEEAEDHPSVEAVYARAKALDSSISIATVYRTLSLLEEMELIIKREFNESFARYDTNTDHHHHMIDLETGEVIEFKNEELERIKRKIAHELGYELLDHRLDMYGRKIKSPL